MPQQKTNLEPGSSTNPYRAPSADVVSDASRSGPQPAERLTRLSALAVDYLLLLLALLIGSLPLFFGTNYFEDYTAVGGFTTVTMGALVLVINLYLLYRNGQTIGKKALDIKVVLVSGERAGFGRLIFIRAPVFLGLSVIPEIGIYLIILNGLLIFTPQRRCGHDLLAGTKVVVAE